MNVNNKEYYKKVYKRLSYSVAGTSVIKNILKPKTDNWCSILNYAKSITDIRKSLCGGCGNGTLYDKNNAAYSISRKNTLEEVKTIVEEIRKINQSDE